MHLNSSWLLAFNGCTQYLKRCSQGNDCMFRYPPHLALSCITKISEKETKVSSNVNKIFDWIPVCSARSKHDPPMPRWTHEPQRLFLLGLEAEYGHANQNWLGWMNEDSILHSGPCRSSCKPSAPRKLNSIWWQRHLDSGVCIQSDNGIHRLSAGQESTCRSLTQNRYRNTSCNTSPAEVHHTK